MGKKTSPVIVIDLRPLQTSYQNRGIGRFCRELATSLASRPDIYKSLIFMNSPNPFPEIPPLIRAPKWKRQWIWDQFILPVILWVKGVKLFHSTVGLGPLDSISFPSFFAGKTVVTIHDLHMFHKDAVPINRFYLNTQRIKIQKKYISKSPVIMANSEKTKNEILKYLPVDAEKISRIYLGTDHIHTLKRNTQNGVNKKVKKKYVLSIGDTENKNIPLAHKIMSKIRESHPDLNWVIVGNYESVFPQITDGYKLPDWIKVRSNITNSELIRLYGETEFLLYPTLEEGFGFPVTEAARLKCPVITSDIEPISELVMTNLNLSPDSQEDSNLENWVGACRKVLEEENFRREMVEKNYSHIQGFTWSNTSQSLQKLYDSALN